MATLWMNDLRNGMAIIYNGEPYIVTSYVHGGTGRGSGNVKVTLKGIINPKNIPVTYGSADKIEEADVNRQNAQYLYSSGDTYTFMDNESYEQFEFSKADLGDLVNYLVEGQKTAILFHNGNPVSVELPPSVALTVVETVPGVKWDTATSGTKPATMNSGLIIQVPLFIKEGEQLMVNTVTGSYQSRV